ncbi:hypothetical protein [Lentzea sp. NPDC059081]|uniref:hypothetical protein n=1 Tax=Lentzea sp. NPDC059081 TaxID=3346719 RepID=UPI0036CA425C
MMRGELPADDVQRPAPCGRRLLPPRVETEVCNHMRVTSSRAAPSDRFADFAVSAALLTFRISSTEVHVISAIAPGIDPAALPYDALSCGEVDDLVAELEPIAAKPVAR